MDDIGYDLSQDHPLRKLCFDTLTALSLPPGRLYDAKYQDSTPFSAVGEAFSSFVSGRRFSARAAGAELEVDGKSEVSQPSKSEKS